MKRIELRSSTLELLQATDNEMIVEGYVNKTNQYSQMLGGRKKFKERILPNAFRNALSRANKINLLLEHDPQKLLASTKNNSLELIEDEIGLKMRAKIVPTTLGKDTYEMVKSGLIDGMSFGFTVIKDSWKKLADNTYLRDIKDLNLFEVTITANPAYAQSSISARNLDIATDVVPENVEEAEVEAKNEPIEATESETKTEAKQIANETKETPSEANIEPKEEVKEEVKDEKSTADIIMEHISPTQTQTEAKSETNIDVKELIASIKEDLKQELLKSLNPAINQVKQSEKQDTEKIADDNKEEQAKEDAQVQEEIKEEMTTEEHKEQEVEEVPAKEKPDYSKYYKELLALK